MKFVHNKDRQKSAGPYVQVLSPEFRTNMAEFIYLRMTITNQNSKIKEQTLCGECVLPFGSEPLVFPPSI
jgi:hypothetical protein